VNIPPDGLDEQIGRAQPTRLDSPTRSERYIMVVDSYWATMKGDFVAAAHAF
jgi:hypothetical protein